MERYIDLHLHSNCSDGVHPPEEVVERAFRCGMAAIALADHDNVDGIDAATVAGERLGIRVVPGVELSVTHGDYQDIHLLGYGFDHRNRALGDALKEFQAFRGRRNRLIVERVNEKLVEEGRAPIDFRRVRELAGGTVGRPHIARALIEQGYVPDTEAAFRRYLIPCNVTKRLFPIGEAIALIHRAGGVAVLAHPVFIARERRRLEELVVRFIAMGLDGVEAYNAGSTNDDIDWHISLAHRHGLLVTGGSDFHGLPGEQTAIGVGRGNLRIPYRRLEELERAVTRRRQMNQSAGGG